MHNMLTVQDLVGRYEVTRQTIYRWINRGWLPPRVSMPGTTPFWYAFMLDQWEQDRGINPVSAAHAAAHGVSPCFAAMGTITDLEVAGRWNVRAETVRRWAKMAAFPQPTKSENTIAPSDGTRAEQCARALNPQPTLLVFNIAQIMSFELAHGGAHEFAAFIRLEEQDFINDQRADDGDFTAVVPAI